MFYQYSNPSHINIKIDDEDKSKKLELKKFKRSCYRTLRSEYNWPINISKATAKLTRPPRNRKTLADYVLGLTVGNFPNRYVEPIAKFNNTNKNFYTGLSILTDFASLGITASAIWGVGAASNLAQESIGQFHEYIGLGEKAFNFVLQANFYFRATAIPFRMYKYNRGEHTPSYASIISTNPLVFTVFNRYMIHDVKESIKERKQENKSWLYTYLGINKFTPTRE